MPGRDALLRLAAELDAEVERVARTVAEAAALGGRVSSEPVALYAAAALLDTFYTGIEKALSRLAPALNGGLPEGPAWHRRLLEGMCRPIEGIRPAVLSLAAARSLDPYLGFRHRFRNMYLFDLEPDLVGALLAGLPPAWALCAGDLESFARWLRGLAAAGADGTGG
jgi:hypothetical protein